MHVPGGRTRHALMSVAAFLTLFGAVLCGQLAIGQATRDSELVIVSDTNDRSPPVAQQTPKKPAAQPNAASAKPAGQSGPSPMQFKGAELSPDSTRVQLKPTRKLPPARQPAQAEEPESPVATTVVKPTTPSKTKPSTKTAAAKTNARVSAISFDGLRPGTSSLAEVNKVWGEPVNVQRQEGFIQNTYSVDRFERIAVVFQEGGKVQSIAVKLKRPLPVADLVQQLELETVVPVDILSKGRTIGLVYPERCTAFTLAAGEKDHVSHVVFDCPDAQPFLMRAETRMAANYTGALADLETALELDPHNPQAEAQRARILSRIGHSREALAACQAATEQDPDCLANWFLQARIQNELGEFTDALATAKHAMSKCPGEGVERARAMYEMGDAMASGPERDYHTALEFHMNAIRLADDLRQDSNPTVRREAHEVLLDAHLAAANDIAWGDWKSKEIVVPKWLARAEAIVADGETADQRRADSEKVCRKALSASVGMQGKLDPEEWLVRLLEGSRERIAQLRDPMNRQQAEWELGLALYDALQAYQMRGNVPQAIKYGLMAASHFEKAIDGHRESAIDTYVLGRLYFRMGSMHAIAKKDHREAVRWFEKAWSPLTQLMPTSAWADPGRQGETLVSMAVSYWAAGQQEKALQLTRQGVEWMELAVQDGVLDKQSLSVPYANLAAMHKHLGETDKAQGFSELAERLKATKLR